MADPLDFENGNKINYREVDVNPRELLTQEKMKHR